MPECENCGAEAIGSILTGFDDTGKLIVKWLCLECIVETNYDHYNTDADCESAASA